MFINQAIERWGSYQGLSQRPLDFDQFWQAKKAQVDQLGLDYQIQDAHIPSTIAKGYWLTFQGVGGGSVLCQLVVPTHIDTYGLMLQFHGYHGSSGDWHSKIGLAADGFATLALNVRGQGGDSYDNVASRGNNLRGHIIRGVEGGPASLFYTRIFQDVYQMTRIGLSLTGVDPNRVYAQGASQGGALALVATALSQQVKQAFVMYPFLSDYRRAYMEEPATSAYEELMYYLRRHDPNHSHQDDFFKTLDYIDMVNFAPWIQVPVLWGIGLRDRACPPVTQFAVYNHLAGPKEMVFYPEHEHEDLPNFYDKVRKVLLGLGH